MKKNIIILLLVAIVIGLPFLFQKEETKTQTDGDQLIILTPHNAAVRHEFEVGFRKWYFDKTGRSVFIDWRDLGGGKETIKFISTTFANAFKKYWIEDLGKEWTQEVSTAYRNLNIERDITPGTIEAEVRNALLTFNISCGVDILFGGGRLEISLLAGKGLFVHSGILMRQPDWFKDDVIPQKFGGNYFWEPTDLWIGTASSVFGIVYNRDVLKELGIKKEPDEWKDIADPAYFGKIALTDPTMSSSVATALEMIFQQQMQETLRDNIEAGAPDNEETLKVSLDEGWLKGLSIIQKICGNSRYFTSQAPKPVIDVAAGNCAAGIAIDYYGLTHEENLRKRTGDDRFSFAMPKGGSVVDPDPIAMLRGAPHPELTSLFIEYVVSLDGQKKWAYKVGTPGGPDRYALRRAPIRKDMYSGKHMEYRSDPNINFYRDVADFRYTTKWTGPYTKEFRIMIKSAFIDPHKELVGAWSAIIEAQKEGRYEDAEKALKVMEEYSLITYSKMIGPIHEIVTSGSPIDVVRLEGELTRHFTQQYREARRLATGS